LPATLLASQLASSIEDARSARRSTALHPGSVPEWSQSVWCRARPARGLRLRAAPAQACDREGSRRRGGTDSGLSCTAASATAGRLTGRRFASGAGLMEAHAPVAQRQSELPWRCCRRLSRRCRPRIIRAGFTTLSRSWRLKLGRCCHGARAAGVREAQLLGAAQQDELSLRRAGYFVNHAGARRVAGVDVKTVSKLFVWFCQHERRHAGKPLTSSYPGVAVLNSIRNRPASHKHHKGRTESTRHLG
jgi:hypothetical protein